MEPDTTIGASAKCAGRFAPSARTDGVVSSGRDAETTESRGALEPGTPEFIARCKEFDCRSFVYRSLKRLFDVVFSLCVLVIGFIPGLLLSIAIAVDTKGAPIYSQVRVGKYGKPFKIYKFRTMVADSDNVEKYFTSEQLETWKSERKVSNDPRITKIGRVLRASSIDETPQFFNVLLGQISVIGPRAITFIELDWFGDKKCLLLSVPPGITGLWQIGARNDATFASGRRQAIELEYVRGASLLFDAKVFFGTFSTIVKKTGK